MPRIGLRALLPLAASGVALPTVEDAVAWLSSYPSIIVLPVIAVTGELAVIASVVVAVQGAWSLPEIVLWLFVGTVASDLLWFRLAGVVDARWLGRAPPHSRHQRALRWLRRRTGERPYLALLFVKFLYGSRFLTIVYVATRRIPVSRFLLYDGLGTLAWLVVLVPLGWLVARGAVSSAAAGRLDVLALALVGLLLVLRGGTAWLTRRADRRSQPS